MRELTDNDKERIYKEVNRIFNESESVDLVHELMFKVGEYEHNYQREQQAKGPYTVSENSGSYQNIFLDGKIWMGSVENSLAIEICNKLNERVKLLAERSKLRNKVIEEAIEQLNSPLLNFSDGLIYKGTVIELLNALKK